MLLRVDTDDSSIVREAEVSLADQGTLRDPVVFRLRPWYPKRTRHWKPTLHYDPGSTCF